MNTLRIDILNPKAAKLLKELAALDLIAIYEDKQEIPEHHKKIVRERIKRTKQSDLLDWNKAKKKLKFD